MQSIWAALRDVEDDRHVIEKIRDPAQITAVALKADARVADA